MIKSFKTSIKVSPVLPVEEKIHIQVRASSGTSKLMRPATVEEISFENANYSHD
jgi:hypothetical protein